MDDQKRICLKPVSEVETEAVPSRGGQPRGRGTQPRSGEYAASGANIVDYRKAYGLRGGGRGSASAEAPSSSSLDTLVTNRRTLNKARLNEVWLDKGRNYWGAEQSDAAGLTQRRVRRLYQRFFTGLGLEGRLRFLTLTSSDAAVAAHRDIHRDWEVLLKRIRRLWGHFEYIGVQEIMSDRVHLHIVFRGSYMEQQHISHLWEQIHQSPVVYIEAVRRGACEKLGRYLAKYLAKSMCNRYWASHGWVFKGWVGWSKRVRKWFGYYPSRELVQGLARLGSGAADAAEALLSAWKALGGRALCRSSGGSGTLGLVYEEGYEEKPG